MRRALLCVAAAAAGLVLGGCSTFPSGGAEARRGRSVHMTTIHDAAGFAEGGWVVNGEVVMDPHWLLLRPMGPWPDQVAAYESPVVRSAIRFNEALLSWNVDVPEGAGVRFDVRVGDTRTGEWSPWMYVGRWGTDVAPGQRVQQTDFGYIDVDYFRSDRRFDAAQYRIIAVNSGQASNGAADAQASSLPVRVRRIALTFSNRAPVPHAGDAPQETSGSALPLPGARPAPAVAMDVPFRSQKAEDRDIAGRICSPTSVTMVLAYRGVDHPVATVAARALDPDSGIYGNWPCNVQTAYTFGVPGYLTRFNDWAEVREALSRDQPLVVSIQAREGELSAAPYRRTAGHLLVIRGLDENGDVLVNDPAARTPEEGVTTYPRADMERVWLQRGGGTAYVLLPAGER